MQFLANLFSMQIHLSDCKKVQAEYTLLGVVLVAGFSPKEVAKMLWE